MIEPIIFAICRRVRLRPAAACWCAVAAVVGGAAGCGEGGDAPDFTKPAADAGPTVSEQSIVTALESAQSYISRGDLASARTILEELAAQVPDDVRPVEQLGQVLYRQSLQTQDDLQSAALRNAAADAYRRAVEIDPDSAGLRHSAGLILLSAGHDDDALAMFETAGQIDPGNPQHPLYAAQLLIKAKQYDKAQAALQRALKLDASLPHVHASLAVVAMERGEFDIAIQHMQTARVLDPHAIDLRAQEARVLRRAGRPRDALERLMSLPQHIRGQTAVATEIAASYEAIDAPQRAANAWQVAYTHQINEPSAWYPAAKAAAALLEAGQREQALIWLRYAEMTGPREQLVRDVRAQLESAGRADELDDTAQP